MKENKDFIKYPFPGNAETCFSCDNQKRKGSRNLHGCMVKDPDIIRYRNDLSEFCDSKVDIDPQEYGWSSIRGWGRIRSKY